MNWGEVLATMFFALGFSYLATIALPRSFAPMAFACALICAMLVLLTACYELYAARHQNYDEYLRHAVFWRHTPWQFALERAFQHMFLAMPFVALLLWFIPWRSQPFTR